MRRHAKASSAGWIERQAIGLGHICALGGLCALLLAVMAGSASGATVTDRPLLFTFDGTASAGPLTEAGAIAIDNATGDVYIANDGVGGFGFVSKFDANGVPANFTATGSSSLESEFTNVLGVAVDNSGGANQGRVLVSQYGETRIKSFDPSGALQWIQLETGGQLEDVAVDSSGHPWSSWGEEYDNAGNPPAKIFSLGATGKAIDVDANDNVYLAAGFGGAVEKYVGGSLSSTLDPSAWDVYTDQSSTSGHIFTVDDGGYTEFDSSGAEIVTLGTHYVGNGRSIAYNPALDRIYVLQGGADPLVAVFGPSQTGTVADTTIEVPGSVGISGAHFSGTVNPQNTSSEWRFEWRKVGEPWDTAQSSPAQSLPTDSNAHTVELTTNHLRGDTAYEVRLIAVNTANQLAGFSAAESFATTVAPEAPAVTISTPSPVTTTTAKIGGTVNPEGDTADWRVQLSTDPACSSGFKDMPLQPIAEASASPVSVEYELTGLLPSAHYCARIAATNSAGTTTSETKQFTTVPTAADELEAIAPAPRLDTSARLNARVNPEGEDMSYRFEYSSDGGSTWQNLPDRVDTSGARAQKVIAEVVDGLQPSTTYSYRVWVENPVGSETSQPLGFTTRSTAEATLRKRGIELVSAPNKGNQNVSPPESIMQESPMSEDGEKALWSIRGGSPSGHTGTGSTFIAERTPSGWQSRSVQPPAEQQIGGGNNNYQLVARTPDMSQFIFSAARSVFFGSVEEATFVRLGADQNQTVLKRYESNMASGNAEITNDGSHILVIDRQSGQLEDIGSGAPEVVSIMPDGTQSTCGLTGGQSFSGAFLEGTQSGVSVNWRSGYHLIDTTDASIVFFEAKPNGNCSAPQGLYVRDRQAEETELIDPGTAKHEVEFIRATPDGRHAYFLTYSQLDSADANTSRDVYRWDEASGESSCLSCMVPSAAIGEDMERGSAGTVLVSDDFAHIYFVSKRKLVPGKGVEGSPNLYDISGGQIRFVAAVEAQLFRGDGSSISDDDSLTFIGTAGPSITADVTNCGSPCFQLYHYEPDTNSVECVSCARGVVTTHEAIAEFQVSADGSTVAFKTDEALVPTDINRTTDLYEWRNGVRQLITNGADTFPTQFARTQIWAVSSTGRDFLFAVVDPGLTGYEQDELLNLYDARVDGGFPRPTSPTHCSEESCQGPLQAAPGQPPTGSKSFSGQGNVPGSSSGRKCAKGKVRRQGRCVGRHQKHHKRAGHANRGTGK